MLKFKYGPRGRKPRTRHEVLKFLKSVAIKRPGSKCWVWPRYKTDRGYGMVRYQSQLWRVHRLMWMLKNGPIPKGKEICHDCDYPPCYNLKHLFAGSHTQNMRDAFKKNRVPPRQGENHGCAKLKECEVRQIRKLYKRFKIPQWELAEHYGVRQATIHCITARKNWRHI